MHDFVFFGVLRQSDIEAQADMELGGILLPRPPGSAGVTAVNHHSQL